MKKRIRQDLLEEAVKWTSLTEESCGPKPCPIMRTHETEKQARETAGVTERDQPAGGGSSLRLQLKELLHCCGRYIWSLRRIFRPTAIPLQGQLQDP